MRLIEEIIIDTSAAVDMNISGRARGVAGMDVTIQRNDDGLITIRSIAGAGLHLLMSGRPVQTNNGTAATFGGPAAGDLLRFTWTNANVKDAVIRLWDEPIRPFGSFLHDEFEQLALAPATLSGNWVLNSPGAWVSALRIVTSATDDARLDCSIAGGSITHPFLSAAAFTAGGQIHYGDLPLSLLVPPALPSFRWFNNAAGSIDVRGTSWADCK